MRFTAGGPRIAYPKTDSNCAVSGVVSNDFLIIQLFGLDVQVSSQLPDFLVREGLGLAGSGPSGGAAVFGGLLSHSEAQPHENQSYDPHQCPEPCDPVKAAGGPDLARPEYALFGLLLFLIGGYFSQRGFYRMPLSAEHVVGWLMNVCGSVLLFFSCLPTVLRLIWQYLL